MANVKKNQKIESSDNKRNKSTKRKPQISNAAKNKSKREKKTTLRVISGIVLIALTIFTFLSMLSYVIGCVQGVCADMVAEYHPFRYLFSRIQTTNFMGRLGDLMAILFLKKLFGISSFVLVFAGIHCGLKLLIRRGIVRRKKVFPSCLFLTMLFSTVLAVLFHNQDSVNLFYNILPGQFGLLTYTTIEPVIGCVGIIIVSVVAFLVFSYFRYDLDIFKLFERTETHTPGVKDKTKKQDEDEIESADNEDTEGEDEEDVDDESVVEKEEISDEDETVDEEQPVEEEESVENDSFSAGENVSDVEEPAKKLESFEDEVEIKLQNNNIDAARTGVGAVDVVERPEEEVVSEKDLKNHYTIDEQYDPTLDLPDFEMPPVSLLNDYDLGNKSDISDEEIEQNRQNIRTTLQNYKIEIQSIKATVGPTITLYEIVPAPGVRIAKIKNLEDDIALSLAAFGIRIIAPMPGRGTIGIEVPNSSPQVVSMRSVLSSKRFLESTMELPIALGKTIQNETFVVDLAKMPHLLVAGATGQGKSVGLNAIITSLLYKKHPSQLKFVMVDPKKVELPLYGKLENHYLAMLPSGDDAIITDTKQVVNTLNSLIIEMDDRYNLLKKSGVRNIKEYNARFIARRLNPENGHRFLPYIVVVIDEFADLIMTAGREVETPLARLAQLARAIGIHLIIATQRPSVNIITGTIKANFPARLAFRVVSKIDSRTILDCGGADQLIGRGDMLLSTGSDLTRLQCAFVDTDEVEKLTEFIGNQQGYASALFLPNYSCESSEESTSSADLKDRDPLFEEAARLVVNSGSGSTSNIQRKMNLGYNRAGRIMDQLEVAGIVGPAQGSKPRELYVQDEMELNVVLEGLRNR